MFTRTLILTIITILPLTACQWSPPPQPSPFNVVDNGKALTFNFKDRRVLQYNYGTIQPPEGTDPIFARSGYIHPVWSPEGARVTNDFPKAHLHHHGIWFPWTNTIFDGRKTDFWNSKAKQGLVRFTKLLKSGTTPDHAYFSALHEHVATNTPDKKPVVVLNERWDVKIIPHPTAQLFELTSTQSCATDKPLHLKKYHYGGLGFRGSTHWEGKGEACKYLTSEGKTRADGHGTRSRWCAIYQKVDNKTRTVVIMSHPTNFRHPQPMRIHPSEPFFCYAPEALGDFDISPGTPYVSKYRFFIHDGEPDVKQIEQIYSNYTSK